MTSNLEKRDGLVHCSVKNAAVCEKTIVKESHKFELEEEERKKIWPSGDFLVRYIRDAF